jgi:hypothetical protein
MKIIYYNLRPAGEFFTYGDIIVGEGLQNLHVGLCLALRAFGQEGVFIVSHLM